MIGEGRRFAALAMFILAVLQLFDDGSNRPRAT
jgi:hypothetical protein